MTTKVFMLGVLCALSAAVVGIDPREVDLEAAKRQLMALGAIVPNEIEAHLAVQNP